MGDSPQGPRRVDPVRYEMSVRSTPTLQWTMSGKRTTIMTRSYDNVSWDEFSKPVDFLIDYAVKANEAYLSVGAPSTEEQGPA